MTSTHVAVLFSVILFATSYPLARGIPIDINNGNRNNQPSQHPHQPYIRPQNNHYHQHQSPGQSKTPEMEDSGRMNTNSNYNQFKRHSVDIKVTPGNFQHNPSEQFGGTNGGNGFYQPTYEDHQQPRSSNFIRNQHQTPPMIPKPGETQETRYGPHSPTRQNLQHPAPSQGPSRFTYLHPGEGRKNQKPDSFNSNTYSNLFDENERTHNPQVHQDGSRSSQTYSDPYLAAHKKRFQEAGSFAFDHFPSLKHQQPGPTVALVVPEKNGNSTLFIEYDISNKDVTYETTVEVEDSGESNEL